MKPLVTKIKQIPQGNKNHVAWALARKNQTKQFLIMNGQITKNELTAEYPEGIPIHFDPSKLPTIECAQIVWYNEVHMEQHGGPLSSTGYQVRFKSDKDGKLDNTDAGSYSPEKTTTTYKYTGQARFFSVLLL